MRSAGELFNLNYGNVYVIETGYDPPRRYVVICDEHKDILINYETLPEFAVSVPYN